MLAYPIVLEDDDGILLATCPDFPELATFGDNREAAIDHAVDALEEAIAARIHDGKNIPPPSHGETYAILPTLTSVKVMLYQGMRDQGIGKAELARRLRWHMPQVDRVLDVEHRSRLDKMDAALKAIGRRLHVIPKTLKARMSSNARMSFSVEGLHADGQVTEDEPTSIAAEAKITKRDAALPLCGDGCGEYAKPGRRFLPGHDAKLHSLLLKIANGHIHLEQAPPLVQERLASGMLNLPRPSRQR